MTAWLSQHRRACAGALMRFARAPLSALLSTLVLGLALALPASGAVVLANLSALAGELYVTPQLSVFLELDAGRKEIDEVESSLRRYDSIREIRFVSRDEALKQLGDDNDFGTIVDGLSRNPLPDAFIVTPRGDSPQQVQQLHDELAKLPPVEHVQLDSAWVRRLDAMLGFGRTLLILVCALLGAALVSVTFNTIRLQILTQREEIDVSRLLGATEAFIHRPFYYFGAIQGVFGAVTAWLIVWGTTILLREPVTKLGALYDIDFRFGALPPMQTAVMFLAASLLGWLGAHLSVRQHLRGSDNY